MYQDKFFILLMVIVLLGGMNCRTMPNELQQTTDNQLRKEMGRLDNKFGCRTGTYDSSNANYDSGDLDLKIRTSSNIALAMEEQRILESILEKEARLLDSHVSPLASSYVGHNPISIDGNANFSTQASNENWPGSGGSELNPIIISGYNITNSSCNLLEIRNTDLYFQINDSFFNGVNGLFNGIYLENVTHGVIVNNMLTWCNYSIWLNDTSSQNKVIWNFCSNNSNYGVRLFAARHNLVMNNTCFDNRFGIHSWESNNNIIVNNTCYNNSVQGICLYQSMHENVTQNSCFNNTYNGIVTYYSNNSVISDNWIYENGHGNQGNGIALINSNHTVISKNVVYSNSRFGIVTDYSENNTISTNTVYNTVSYDGIHLYYSNNTTVFNNTVSNTNQQKTGIRLWYSNNNTLSSNTASNNQEKGIVLAYSDHCKITDNIVQLNEWGGIWLEYCNHGKITDNIIAYQNEGHGIQTIHSSDIVIVNNTAHDNGWIGIYLEHISDSFILNNTVSNNNDTGIRLYYSYNNTLSTNTVSNNLYDGILLIFSGHCNITNNIIAYQNEGHGITTLFSSDNVVVNNTAHDNGYDGINLGGSSDSSILENIVYNNDLAGICLESTNDTRISFNTVYNNGEPGIWLVNSHRNNVTNNQVFDNVYGGVLINSDYTRVSYNVIFNNGEFGLDLESESSNNTVEFNDFASSDPNAFDHGSNNIFVMNYWNDWSGSGAYALPGDATNSDLSPLENPYHLSAPIITHPTGTDVSLFANVTIIWMPAIDAFDHALTYAVYYSTDEGITWTALASKLEILNYTLDTTTIADGTYILLKVEATDVGGFISKGISETMFPIWNLSPPTIIFPNGGETLNGTVIIDWDASFDPSNLSIIYAVYYSSDNGVFWTMLATGLTTTSYSWDTTTVRNGFSYLVKVEATNSAGVTRASISDDTFSIQNPASTSTTPGMRSLMLFLAFTTLIVLRILKLNKLDKD